MRALRLALALVSPALTGGAMLAAQTVERTDVPDRGMIRFTFDPRIMTWNSEFTDAGRLGLGRGLTGDTVGSAYIPCGATRAGRTPGERRGGVRSEPGPGATEGARGAPHPPGPR